MTLTKTFDMDIINNAYVSDKYQYTMGKSYRECGKQNQIAVFNLFYRKAPENNNWAVVSGTEEVIEMVLHLGTEPEEFYEKFLPGEEYREFRKYLSTMKFTGDVYTMREGEIAFPNQPIVTVVGPMIEAQVLETPMLCILNHQMAVATKASRVCRSTDKPVSEFGSRRAHGPWAAVYGGKAAQIAGCASSSINFIVRGPYRRLQRRAFYRHNGPQLHHFLRQHRGRGAQGLLRLHPHP